MSILIVDVYQHVIVAVVLVRDAKADHDGPNAYYFSLFIGSLAMMRERMIEYQIYVNEALGKYSGKVDPIQLRNELFELLSFPLSKSVPYCTLPPVTHPEV